MKCNCYYNDQSLHTHTHTQLTTHEITYLEFITVDRLTRWQRPTIEFCIKIQFLHNSQYFVTKTTNL